MSDFEAPSFSDRGPDVLGAIRRRILAQLLDSLVIGMPLFFVTLAMGVTLTDKGISNNELTLLTAVFVGTTLAYHTIAIAYFGTTIGKRICGLRVVNRLDGGRVSLAYAAVRALVPTLVQLVPLIGPALSLAVYVRAIFHPLKQGLHDAAAGTLVVKR